MYVIADLQILHIRVKYIELSSRFTRTVNFTFLYPLVHELQPANQKVKTIFALPSASDLEFRNM